MTTESIGSLAEQIGIICGEFRKKHNDDEIQHSPFKSNLRVCLKCSDKSMRKPTHVIMCL